MTTSKFARLRTPVSIALIGTVIAGALATSGRWSAVGTVVIFVVIAVTVFYRLGGRDSDVGAVLGHHVDERQRELRVRAMSLAMQVMYLAAIVCVAIALALKQNYWQADVIGSSGGLAFLIGLKIYGSAESTGNASGDEGEEMASTRDAARGVME